MHLDWTVPIRNFPFLLTGAALSLLYTLVIFTLAFILSSFIATARYYKKLKITYGFATVYVELFRNIPCMVVMFIVYFGLPQFGISVNKVLAGVGTVSIVIAAYMAEIVKSGLASVPKGQWEAGRCIGLSEPQIFLEIIFPQAIKNVFPAIGNQFIGVIYATSLLSTLDIRELTQQATLLNSRTFRTFEIYVFVTCMYIGISQLIQFLLRIFSAKLFSRTAKA